MPATGRHLACRPVVAGEWRTHRQPRAEWPEDNRGGEHERNAEALWYTRCMDNFTCTRCGWSGVVKAKQRRCLACARRKITEWRQRNPQKVAAQKVRNRLSRLRRDPDWENRKRRLRRARNPETSREAQERRRLWLAEGDVTRQDLIDVYERDGGKCVYCKTEVKCRYDPSSPRGFDHTKSRRDGGKHTAKNITVCCATCNVQKG